MLPKDMLARCFVLRKLLANKIFIIILVALLLVAVIIFDSIQGNFIHNLSSPITLALQPVQTAISGGGNAFADFYSSITEGIEIRNKNRELEAQIAELQYQVQQQEEAAIRWEELKEAFHIKDTFENYEIYGAPILSREADEWFSVIRVGVGSNDGIVINEAITSYAVVDAQMHLVGKVLSSDLTSAKILPLLHEGFSVSARVNAVNGATVIVHGEIELKEDGLLKVDQISDSAVLKVGDELVTSGSGGLFPAGIPIGVIVSIDDSSPLNRFAMMKPYADISSLTDVFIMVPPVPEAAPSVGSSATQGSDTQAAGSETVSTSPSP